MTFKQSIEDCIGNILLMCNPGKASIIKDDELEGFVIEFQCLNEEHKERIIEYAFYYALCPKFCVIRCVVNNTALKKYTREELIQIIDGLMKKFHWDDDIE